MSNNRTAAVALIVGSCAGLATMALHPTGHDVIRNATAGESNALVVGIHTLALLGQGLLLSGTLALPLVLHQRRGIATGGYVFYALACVAAILAAGASGFVGPSAVHGLAEADQATRAMMINNLYYTGLLNQAFARIYVLFSASAILLWSFAAVKGRELTRPLGIYGVFLATLLLLGVLGGQLRLDVHGFGLVVLGEGIWLIWAAAQLWRRPDR
jgi:hypothetical protein